MLAGWNDWVFNQANVPAPNLGKNAAARRWIAVGGSSQM